MSVVQVALEDNEFELCTPFGIRLINPASSAENFVLEDRVGTIHDDHVHWTVTFIFEAASQPQVNKRLIPQRSLIDKQRYVKVAVSPSIADRL